MDDIFFSIIIPALNEEKRLPMLLQSLSSQTEKNFEVIVVDGGSTDKTEDKAREFTDKFQNFIYHKEKLKNVSMSRNAGAKQAKAKWLIFFDADVEIESDFVRQIKEKILSKNLDVLTVWNRSKEDDLTGKIILGLLNVSMSMLQKIQPVANGPCMIMKREIFNAVHGFDTEIKFGEDYNLMLRMRKLIKKFAVLRSPRLLVSTRRFSQEGLFLSLFKSMKALLYQIFIGPIKKPIFEYKMGGQNYK
jgi:glycosyltransferase involved in cell wall biosynthesis